MRILVADDNAVLLGMVGHEVRVAFDGDAALRTARSWRPDAAVLDLRMPILDGLSAAIWMRENLPEMALVALSGYVGTCEPPMDVFDRCFIKGTGLPAIDRELKALVQLRSAGRRRKPLQTSGR